jgi:hypothetical protein
MSLTERSLSWIAGATGAFVMLAMGILSPPLGAAPQDSLAAFCKRDRIVRDYWSVLSAFPQAHGFSRSGRLRIGPSALRVFPPKENLVVVKRDHFEATGFLAHSSQANQKPLGLRVVSRLERVNRHGVRAKLVKSKDQFIEKVGGFSRRDFGFGANVPPGVYRLSVSFQRKSGELLDKYEEYFRAVVSRSSLQLAISQPSFLPGEMGYLRVDNYGTVSASYSYGYRIWKREGQVTTELPLEAIYLSRDRPLAKAGYASKCFSFLMPKTVPAGEYQIGIPAKDPTLSKPTLLLGRFSVIS